MHGNADHRQERLAALVRFSDFHATEAAALFDSAAYAEMERLLERAQKTIRVTFYLFGGPDAERMIAVMAAKQAAGVDVRVLLDRAVGFGATLPEVLWECRRTYRSLRRLGIDVRRSDPRPLPGSHGPPLSHHKYIVADDREALVGGMNVGTLFRRYHDLMLHLRGPVIGDLSRQFDADWEAAAGSVRPPQELEDLAPFADISFADISFADISFADISFADVCFSETPSALTLARIVGTGRDRRTTQTALSQNLRRASSSICVALCEMGRTTVLDDLIASHRRGVRVRVLLDPQIMARLGPAGILNAGAVQALLEAGVAVHLYQIGLDFVRLHLKMALFDGRSAIAGSTNWTRGGFEWVGETDVELHGGPVITELADQFERDWQHSVPAAPPTPAAHFLHGLYEKWAQ